MTALCVRNIAKAYESTVAVADISFSIGSGKVLAICGENGAGKSTLMKILSGATRPDKGEILIDEMPVLLPEPADAMNYGIRTVYQELSLLPHISVAENMLLGRMPTNRSGFVIDWKEANRFAGKILSDLGFGQINPRDLLGSLSIAQQQIIEIAKALVSDPRILILDEPTAVLSASETERLFTHVRKLAASGKTILYISHRLEEIFDIADEVVVLKDGRSVLQEPVNGLSQRQLIEAMVGRPLSTIFPKRDNRPGDVILKIENLSRTGAFTDISLTVHAGEIVGMFGLVGSGRTEVAQAIFGSRPAETGTIQLYGELLNILTPMDAVRHGVAMITEDRKGDGLALDTSVLDNVSLASFQRISHWGVLDNELRHKLVDAKAIELDIRPSGTDRPVRQLSGGNQQKVVIAKWLLVENTRLFIFDEPTRGVDIATKMEIYQIIAELACQGVAILLISSELPEVLGLSNRLLVMREGHLVAELTPDSFKPELIFSYSAGLSPISSQEVVH
ncbi:MAG: sugar ABC transporter ATP-binding protein [Rhizobiaceae bacterium]|nr:sugar ABC transporter ATP-binding protein [Rhizobiaceae bacterium]